MCMFLKGSKSWAYCFVTLSALNILCSTIIMFGCCGPLLVVSVHNQLAVIQRWSAYTVEPVYSGHPWDTTSWLLHTGPALQAGFHSYKAFSREMFLERMLWYSCSSLSFHSLFAVFTNISILLDEVKLGKDSLHKECVYEHTSFLFVHISLCQIPLK